MAILSSMHLFGFVREDGKLLTLRAFPCLSLCMLHLLSVLEVRSVFLLPRCLARLPDDFISLFCSCSLSLLLCAVLPSFVSVLTLPGKGFRDAVSKGNISHSDWADLMAWCCQKGYSPSHHPCLVLTLALTWPFGGPVWLTTWAPFSFLLDTIPPAKELCFCQFCVLI